MICRGCLVDKELDSFPVRKDRSNRLRPYCYICVNSINRYRYSNHRTTNPFLHKATRAKARSHALGLSYDLDAEYLKSIWTGMCPVLQTEIFLHERSRSDGYAAELDRFIPELGYVRGNVHFLSRRANRLKNNVSTKELKQLITWMEKIESSKSKC